MFNIDLMNVGNIMNEDFSSLESDLQVQNPEHDIIITEQLIEDSYSNDEIKQLISEGTSLQEMVDLGILQEKTIVKLDKKAKKSKAEAQAELVIARERNDRDFKKLVTIWKLRKVLLDRIHKKYNAQAKTRVRQNQRNVGKLKNNKIAKRIGA